GSAPRLGGDVGLGRVVGVDAVLPAFPTRRSSDLGDVLVGADVLGVEERVADVEVDRVAADHARQRLARHGRGAGAVVLLVVGGEGGARRRGGDGGLLRALGVDGVVAGVGAREAEV